MLLREVLFEPREHCVLFASTALPVFALRELRRDHGAGPASASLMQEFLKKAKRSKISRRIQMMLTNKYRRDSRS
jgi:hypothetical protein